MSQLVGLPCAVCNERIGTVAEGRFCATCGSPVHTRCATPWKRGAASCGTCGAAAELAATHRQQSQEEDEAVRRAFRVHRLTWGILSAVGGLACLLAGFVVFLANMFYGSLVIAFGAGAMVRGVTLLCRTEPRRPVES